MIKVSEWINESREVRTIHLDLTDACIDRGGNSTVHRGVLAQYLDTDIPSRVDLCHACHNDKCSNPKHLYWGTRKENVRDAIVNGTWPNQWEQQVAKYGLEEARRMRSVAALGNKGGAGNKGKSLSDEHKKNISMSLSRKGSRID